VGLAQGLYEKPPRTLHNRDLGTIPLRSIERLSDPLATIGFSSPALIRWFTNVLCDLFGGTERVKNGG
jgi:hypothetical protein